MPHFGSFESWSAVVRAALIHAGQIDPYSPAAVRDDQRCRLLRTVALGLKELDEERRGLTAAQIIKNLDTPDYLPAAVQEMADAIAELVERVTGVVREGAGGHPWAELGRDPDRRGLRHPPQLGQVDDRGRSRGTQEDDPEAGTTSKKCGSESREAVSISGISSK